MENEVTLYFFLSRVKAFLKQLLINPSTAVLNDELKHELDIRGISQEDFLKLLIREGIVVRNESIDDEIRQDHQKVTFGIKYKVPRDRFERKVEKLYLRIFGDNRLNEGAWGYEMFQNDTANDHLDEFFKGAITKLMDNVRGSSEDSLWADSCVLADFLMKYKENEPYQMDEYQDALKLCIDKLEELKTKKEWIKRWSKPKEMEKSINTIIKNLESCKKEEKINEEGGGATTACSSGQFSQPLFPVQRRKIYVTQEQYERLFEAVEVDNMYGEFGYEAPGVEIDKDDPTLVHKKKGGIACDTLKESATENFMKEHGIEKEIEPGVGFSEKEQKWYGWSHRGSRGFGIGDVAVECYPSGTKKGNKCKTLEDCKKAAIAFSKSVS